MASIRRGYSDDFTLKNNSVGIGTSTGQEALDVVDGAVKGQDLKVTGISSFTAYEGFLRADHQIAENTTLSFDQGPVSSLSGEIIVGTGQTVTVNEIVKETAGVGNGSGGQWNDLNGNYAFKANGDPTWDGSAFVYDGTGDYHSLSGGDTSTFEVGSSNFTLEQWVYITATSSVVGTFFSKGNDNSVGTNFMSLQTKGANTIPAFFFRAGTALLEGSSVGTGEWHHYVVTRSGDNFTLYVDGTSVDTATNSDSLASGITGGINIGAQSYDVTANSRMLNGKISITRLYSGRVLTAAEVTSNYNAGYTATTSAVAATVDLNANNPASYPGTVRDVDTTDATRAGGSEIECLKVYNTFTPPSGGTNERPYAPKPGELYYNYDFKTIEFFDGYGWRQVDNTTRSGRVLIAGGDISGDPNNITLRIDYLNVNTFGNSIDFGELGGTSRRQGAGCGSAIRGVFMGGQGPSANLNEIDYNTIASGGKGVDFGNLLATRQTCGTLSSSTRGISYGAGEPAVDVIEYVEIATTGDSIDFGDCSTARRDHATFSSPTRGIAAGGVDSSRLNDSEFITISSLGNGTDFGELLNTARSQRGLSNSVRGIVAGGSDPATRINTIQFITISSTGNAIYFGDLTNRRSAFNSGGSSNQIRGIFAGGFEEPSSGNVNTIDYIIIATAGDAIDFGDLTAESWSQAASCSDSHGGLGGF